MAFLEQFSEDERELIVSLPYRAGLWLSVSDDDGGTEADYEELHALEDIIERKAAGATYSAVVREVMLQAMDWQGRWKDWSEKLGTVEQDCAAATKLLATKLSEQDVEHYRKAVLSVAREVAEAFREVDLDASFTFKLSLKMHLMFDRFMALFGKGQEVARMVNISDDEKRALEKLEVALRNHTEH